MYILYIIVLDFKLLSLDYITPTLLFLLKLFTSSLLTVTISNTSVIIPHNFNIHTDLSKPGLAMFDLLSFSDFILQPLVIPLTLSLQTNKQTNPCTPSIISISHISFFKHYLFRAHFHQYLNSNNPLIFIGPCTSLVLPPFYCLLPLHVLDPVTQHKFHGQ